MLTRKLQGCIGVTAGVLLVGIGIFPLTPLVFLLVFVRVDPLWFLGDDFRLEFWQTQLIGAGLAITGVWLIRRSLRNVGPAPRDNVGSVGAAPREPSFDKAERGSD